MASSWKSEITLPLIRFALIRGRYLVSHLSLSTQGTRKGSKRCFLCNLSRGVSAFCIFYSEAFGDKEKHGERLEGELSWIERWTTQSSVNTYSENVCHTIFAFIELLEALHHHRRGPYLERTDCVLPCGRQAGVWEMLHTCNSSLLRPVLYFGAALKGL